MPKIKISLPTVLFYSLFLVMNFSLYTILPFVAVIIHECGHLVALLLCHTKINKVTIYPFGVDINFNEALLSYKSEVLICSSGITANLFLSVLCVLFTILVGYNANVLFFTLCNITLIFINILPVKTLDGGKILENALLLHIEQTIVSKIMNVISFIFIVILWIIAVYFFLYTGYNLSLFLMCVYLFVAIFLNK